jgi:hypothetical protein
MRLKRGGVSEEDTMDAARVMDCKYAGTSLGRRAQVAASQKALMRPSADPGFKCARVV